LILESPSVGDFLAYASDCRLTVGAKQQVHAAKAVEYPRTFAGRDVPGRFVPVESSGFLLAPGVCFLAATVSAVAI
jgi:hypothetical protein